MPLMTGSNAGLAYGDYSTNAGFANNLGQRALFDDVDMVATVLTKNTNGLRDCVFVKNGSGSAISAGMALVWVTSYWGTQVKAAPTGTTGTRIRCFAPSYVRGSTSTTIPDGAYFWAIKDGYTSPLSDGTAIAIDDKLVVGATAGQVRADSAAGGGLIYSSVAASSAVTTSAVATKFDQSYTFAANTLKAGDVIKTVAQVIATATNSTDTLTLELMIGSTVIATTGAIDVANNDTFTFISDVTIRTAGASGTLVGDTIVNTATGNATFKSIILASTAVDTTATQQIAVRATWSSASSGNSCRQDVLNISKVTTAQGVSAGTAVAAAATPTAVQFRAAVNCAW